MKFDLHLHTTLHSCDSLMQPANMLRRARELGLAGLVITEHDWVWSEAELDEWRVQAPGFLLFSGVEVSTREGHFLAYGVKNPSAVPAGIAVADLCREVHRQGGAVVAAHPFRWGQPFDEILRDEKPDLDGLEVMSSNMDAECRARLAELRRQHNLPYAELGNSDAHHEDTLAYCYTEFPSTVRDERDLIEAIRQRKTIAHPGR